MISLTLGQANTTIAAALARAKAWGAAGVGASSRTLAECAKDNPNFFVSLSASAKGRFLP